MKDYTFPNTLFLTRLKRKSIPLSVFLCLCFHVFVLNSELFSQSQTLFYRAWNQSSSAVRPEFTNHVVTAVNSSNQTYIAGSTLNTSNTHSLQLTKLLSNGNQSWQTQFTVNTGGDVYVAAIALDGSGNILITGSAYNGSTNNYDLFLVKFNSSGVKQWHVLYNGSGNSYDSGAALVCGSSNEVYVTGATWSSATYIDVVTIAYNSSGSVIWSQTFNNASLTDVGGTIAVSGSEVLVTGFTQTSATNWEFLGLSYQKSNGTFNGSKITNSGGSTIDRITSAAVDASGNIYITGSLGGSGTGLNVKTVKLSPSLNILWTATWNGAANQDDTGRRIAVDGSGNVFITGYTTVSGKRDALLLKYTSSGTLSFANTFDGAEGDDEFQDLVVSSSGNVFVGGYTTKKGNKDFYAAYYSNSGTLIWSEAYNGPYNGNDEIQQVIADGTDGYIVAGPSVGIGTGGPDVVANARTIKYTKHNWVKTSEEKGNAPFIENRGQVINTDGTTENNVRYYARNAYPNLYLSNSSISYVYAHVDTIPSTQDTMVRLDLSFPTNYSRPNIAWGLEEQDYFNNYYLGHIPEGRERVPLNNKILYPNLYPNMDAAFGQGLDGMFMRFTLKSGSSSSDLKLEFNGKTAISVLSNGNLKVETILEDMELPKPTAALVNSEGAETPITAWAPAYTIGSDGKVGITTGAYDTTKTLVIKIGRDRGNPDAECNTYWSTYYGDTDFDFVLGSDVDPDGNMYVTGKTLSPNFPIFGGILIVSNLTGTVDAFASSFIQPDQRRWSTFFGGDESLKSNVLERNEVGYVIKFHSVANGVYFAGRTNAGNFPCIHEGFSGEYYHTDVYSNNLEEWFSRGFLVKLDSKFGFRKYATLFGDSNQKTESVVGMQILNNGNIVLGGFSRLISENGLEMAGSSGAHQQENGDAFISELSSSNQLVWSTRLLNHIVPISSFRHCTSVSDIAEDPDGNLFITGGILGDQPANSSDNDFIPTGNNTLPSSSNTNQAEDSYVMKFSSARQITWATFFGGDGLDYGNSISCNSTGEVYVTGNTNSNENTFPIKTVGNPANILYNDPTFGGGDGDMFVAKFQNDGTQLWTRYLGGPNYDNQGSVWEYEFLYFPYGSSNASTVDDADNLLITGRVGNGYVTNSTSSTCSEQFFSSINQGVNTSGSDAFLTIIDPNNYITLSTYWGGSLPGGDSDGAYTVSYGYKITGGTPKKFYFFGGETNSSKAVSGNKNIPLCKESDNPLFITALQGKKDGFMSKIYLDGCFTTATQESTSSLVQSSIFPNPTNGNITIQLADQLNTEVRITIFNSLGVQLLNQRMKKDSKQIEINSSTWPSGLYRVLVTDNHQNSVLSFIKI